jgi:hypothetical protein
LPYTISPEVICEWPDKPIPNLYLVIEHDFEVSISFLIEVLRASQIPFFPEDWGWFAWDECDKLLKHNAPSVEWLWQQVLASRREEAMDKLAQHFYRMLRRAFLSTDHGMKPLLVHEENLNAALLHREFDFEPARRIRKDQVQRYSVVYFDATGQVVAVPLSKIEALQLPISTRTTFYYWCDGDLVTHLNQASLIVGAFKIATTVNPNHFEWFLKRARGSVFHSAFQRIEAPKDYVDPNLAPITISIGGGYQSMRVVLDALKVAKRITDWASDQGTVYITSGGHPFDAKQVTTPALYQNAVNLFDQFGYSLTYDFQDCGVRLSKKPD